MDRCCEDIRCCSFGGWVKFISFGVIAITVGTIAGALALAILLVPIYLVQIYKIL